VLPGMPRLAAWSLAFRGTPKTPRPPSSTKALTWQSRTEGHRQVAEEDVPPPGLGGGRVWRDGSPLIRAHSRFVRDPGRR
jgi:hypothetical protein